MSNKPCVLITGATSGIGRQLAMDYAAQGWEVVACGRNQARLEALNSEYGIHSCRFDITDFEAVKAALSGLELRPDVWIFNAGDCEYIEKGRIDSALMHRVLATNFQGLCHCIEAVQPGFKTGDRIVIVSSIAGELPLPRAEAYGASKAAVSYLAKSMALQLEPAGIAVTVVYPGFVETPLTARNDFAMPQMVSVEQASEAIRKGVQAGKRSIYFPRLFTSVLRFIALLPAGWQQRLCSKLIRE